MKPEKLFHELLELSPCWPVSELEYLKGGMEHPGGVRFTNQGLQARAAKSSLARPFMARSYFSSYFWDTTLDLLWKKTL